jgi:hypothetical protein
MDASAHEIARDVAIIVLAIESIVVGVALVFLIIQINSLIRLLRDEIKPLLDSANDTASTLRGTTTFISEKVVNPVISVTSFLSGAQGALKSIVRWRKRGPGGTTE